MPESVWSATRCGEKVSRMPSVRWGLNLEWARFVRLVGFWRGSGCGRIGCCGVGFLLRRFIGGGFFDTGFVSFVCFRAGFFAGGFVGGSCFRVGFVGFVFFGGRQFVGVEPDDAGDVIARQLLGFQAHL